LPNNSSTGGYLAPAAAPAPLEGAALNSFIQAWVVGITGMPGPMVRPRLQSEPPSVPQTGTAWVSIGIADRSADKFPYVRHDPVAGDQLSRHQMLGLLCSFYDNGTNGAAELYAGLMRDGCAIAQNREPLTLAGFALGSVGDTQVVPSLLKETWLYRVDVPLDLRRQIVRAYPVLDLVAGAATLYTDIGLGPDPIVVASP
jgi:hypothetical protein